MRNAENHDEIRKRVRAARRGISEQTREHWSGQICERAANTDWFHAAEKVAGFLAFDGEADPISLMTEAVAEGKLVYVPIIVGKSQPLKFAPWSPTASLKLNRFGILEPDVYESEWIEAREIDLVITPLVAFDKACNRIGVGGGFYDRSFAFTKTAEATAGNRRTRLLGVAHELQKVETVQANEWDVPLDGVATEQFLYVRIGS